jgi:hypothetical protein
MWRSEAFVAHGHETIRASVYYGQRPAAASPAAVVQ